MIAVVILHGEFLLYSFHTSIFIITGDDRNIISGKNDDLGTSFKLNITRKTTSLDKKKTETKCLFARKIKKLEYIYVRFYSSKHYIVKYEIFLLKDK